MIPFLLTFAAIAIVIFFWRQKSYWANRGIPGPEPSLFFGNFYELTDLEYPGVLVLRDWTKKYGKVYGMLEGSRKILVVSDRNMLQELFVKKFENFYARKNHVISGNPDDVRVHVFEAEGLRWKRLRTICSPSFSTNSLRKVSGTMEESVRELVHLLDAKRGEVINIHRYFQELTMDVISRIAMGKKESNFFNNPMIECVQRIFMRDFRSPVLVLAAVAPILRPTLRALFMYFAQLRNSPALPIFTQIYAAVDERIAQREELKANNIEIPEPNDFIDLFLDAKAESDYVEDQKEFTRERVQISRVLSREEIVAQCFVFLLAGFDTTANALAYTISLLARNPEKQQKLQKEIDQVLGDCESINFDDLNKLKYMEMVIKEALRLYPLAGIATSRRCMKATTLGDTKVEEGTMVWADSWSLHYDPEIWGPDVEEFNPERWEQPPPPEMSFIPFGAGPRLCIGKRLAIMEEKLTLAHILSRYNVSTKQTSLKLVGSTTVSPKSVDVVLQPRLS